MNRHAIPKSTQKRTKMGSRNSISIVTADIRGQQLGQSLLESVNE
jgi:hypothetical protein